MESSIFFSLPPRESGRVTVRGVRLFRSAETLSTAGSAASYTQRFRAGMIDTGHRRDWM